MANIAVVAMEFFFFQKIYYGVVLLLVYKGDLRFAWEEALNRLYLRCIKVVNHSSGFGEGNIVYRVGGGHQVVRISKHSAVGGCDPHQRAYASATDFHACLCYLSSRCLVVIDMMLGR